MSEEMPRVTVITVCLNAENSIEAALVSVAEQTYPRIEHLVIDGGSTDRTMELVGKYNNKVALIISEKDQGIYDAMNKGIRLSKGDIVYFLNADDRLHDPFVVSDVVAEFERRVEADIVYGKVVRVNVPLRIKNTIDHDNFEYKVPRDRLKRSNPQQCYFSRRRVFDAVGGFDQRYPVCGDYDWILRCWNRGIRLDFMDRFFAFHSQDGLSYKRRYQAIRERVDLMARNISAREFLFYTLFASGRKIQHILKEVFSNKK